MKAGAFSLLLPPLLLLLLWPVLGQANPLRVDQWDKKLPGKRWLGACLNEGSSPVTHPFTPQVRIGMSPLLVCPPRCTSLRLRKSSISSNKRQVKGLMG